jgi:hypothetical protein
LSEASGGAALDGDGSGDSLTTADGPPLASAVGPSPRAATKGDSEPAAKKVRRSKDAVATDEDEEEEDMGDDEGEADAGDDDDDDEEEPEDEGEDEEEGEEEFEDAGSEVGGPSDYHDPLEYQKQDDTDDETMAADDSD